MENKMNIDSYLQMAEKNFSNMSADMVTQGQNNYGFYGGGEGNYGNNQGQFLAQPMWANMNGQIIGQRGGNFGVGRNMVYGADGGMQGAVVPAKQPTPYQVNVTNTTPNPLTVVLFGLNTYLLTPNFGTSVGVTVTPAQSNVSYLELLQQSASNPFSTSLIRIQTSNPSQITQILTLTSKDAKRSIMSNSYHHSILFLSEPIPKHNLGCSVSCED